MKRKCSCPAGSPFHWKDEQRLSVFAQSDLAKSMKNSLRQTEHIERQRVQGRDISHVAGLSTKTHAQRIIQLGQFVVYSKAGAPK